MGRKGPRAKTKTVLKTVSIVDQLGIMPNSKFQTFLNKNHPNVAAQIFSMAVEWSSSGTDFHMMPLHYWLKGSIRFLNVQWLFLIQGTQAKPGPGPDQTRPRQTRPDQGPR